jgi:hypothetical protein
MAPILNYLCFSWGPKGIWIGKTITNIHLIPYFIILYNTDWQEAADRAFSKE